MSNKYKHIFFDLDHTLWDFSKNARQAMEIVYDSQKTQSLTKVDFNTFFSYYSQINDLYWRLYAQGKITQEDLKKKRFTKAFAHFLVFNETLIQTFAKEYLQLLPFQTNLFHNCKPILEYIKEQGYRMHIITNGFDDIQHLKMKHSGITDYFNNVVTSEKAGVAKPNKGIFELAIKLASCNLQESIMIGDNIDIDIAGAVAIGMDSVHINHIDNTICSQPTYTFFDLIDLKQIL